MEETLEGGRGPSRAVAPLERQREKRKLIALGCDLRVYYHAMTTWII